MEKRIIAILPNSRFKDKLVAVQERLGVYFHLSYADGGWRPAAEGKCEQMVLRL